MIRGLAILAMVLSLPGALNAGGALRSAAAAAPETGHSILLIVDGLPARLFEAERLPRLEALAARGVYYKNCEAIAPFHPGKGRFLDFHNSAIVNAVQTAGTLFIHEKTEYVQDVFHRLRLPTAHSANSNYRSLNTNYTYSYVDNTGDGTDEDALHWARMFLERGRPAFMRIHLQDLGRVARESISAADDEPWKDDIWGEGSPFRRQLLAVDEMISRFVGEIETMGLAGVTRLFITGDHGMSSVGRHPYWDPESARMPLIIMGPGVKAGEVFDYCDSIDIVPTLCRLAGVEAPATAQGIVLAEALVDPPAEQAPRDVTIREINEQLYEFENLIHPAMTAVLDNPPERSRLEIQINAFYDIRHFGDWSAFDSARALHDRNGAILEEVRAIAARHGVEAP